LYALVIGSFYISPLASYVYFNLANGPILLGLSLSVILITICVNYLTINQDYPLETRTKISTLSQLGKGSLISLCIIGVGVICFSILNIIPLTTVLYTASLSWFAIQMIYLRAVNILFEDNALGKGIDQSSIAAMSLFADPVNILMQENNLTNNVVTRLILLIWSVIFQVLEIPVSVFYYLRYKWYLDTVKRKGLSLYFMPEAVKRAHADIYYNYVKKYGRALCYVPKELRTKEICEIAVKKNGLALQSVPEDLKTKEMCNMAVSQNRMALRYVPEGLKTEIQTSVTETPAFSYPRNDFIDDSGAFDMIRSDRAIAPPLRAASFRTWEYNSPFLRPDEIRRHEMFHSSSMSVKDRSSYQTPDPVLIVAATLPLLFL
jgi:hypothetical protein